MLRPPRPDREPGSQDHWWPGMRSPCARAGARSGRSIGESGDGQITEGIAAIVRKAELGHGKRLIRHGPTARMCGALFRAPGESTVSPGTSGPCVSGNDPNLQVCIGRASEGDIYRGVTRGSMVGFPNRQMHQPKEIVEAALKLAPEQREEIINDLWASLDGGLGDEWEEEIQRRVQDVDAGRVKTIPAEEIFSRLEHQFRVR